MESQVNQEYGQPLTGGEVYEKPEIRDFGSLERVTAGCHPATGGDAANRTDTGNYGTSYDLPSIGTCNAT